LVLGCGGAGGAAGSDDATSALVLAFGFFFLAPATARTLIQNRKKCPLGLAEPD
jgi:hypothetical protein